MDTNDFSLELRFIELKRCTRAPMLPALWWVLFSLCSILGVATWYLRNFTERRDITRLCGILGAILMIALVQWTYSAGLIE